MANEKTVVWYRPGRQVKAVRVELTLENMQKLVCNEDGKNKFFNKPLFPLIDNNGNTVDVIFGPCFIAGRLAQGEDDEEEFTDINRDDYLKIVRRFGKRKVENVESKELNDRDRRQLAACQRMLAKLRGNGARRAE